MFIIAGHCIGLSERQFVFSCVSLCVQFVMHNTIDPNDDDDKAILRSYQRIAIRKSISIIHRIFGVHARQWAGHLYVTY